MRLSARPPKAGTLRGFLVKIPRHMSSEFLRLRANAMESRHGAKKPLFTEQWLQLVEKVRFGLMPRRAFAFPKEKIAAPKENPLKELPLRFFPGEGFFFFHFQVASFFKFMAANLSFTQLVT